MGEKAKEDFLGKEFTIFTDGASRGNPGEAGAGVVILDEEGKTVQEISKYLGHITNNSAEYQALILALKEVQRWGGKTLHLFSDSELMVKQLKGIYRVKDRKLKSLYEEVKELLKKFAQFDINHIYREDNQRADKLANQAIKDRSLEEVKAD